MELFNELMELSQEYQRKKNDLLVAIAKNEVRGFSENDVIVYENNLRGKSRTDLPFEVPMVKYSKWVQSVNHRMNQWLQNNVEKHREEQQKIGDENTL